MYVNVIYDSCYTHGNSQWWVILRECNKSSGLDVKFIKEYAKHLVSNNGRVTVKVHFDVKCIKEYVKHLISNNSGVTVKVHFNVKCIKEYVKHLVSNNGGVAVKVHFLQLKLNSNSKKWTSAVSES